MTTPTTDEKPDAIGAVYEPHVHSVILPAHQHAPTGPGEAGHGDHSDIPLTAGIPNLGEQLRAQTVPSLAWVDEHGTETRVLPAVRGGGLTMVVRGDLGGAVFVASREQCRQLAEVFTAFGDPAGIPAVRPTLEG